MTGYFPPFFISNSTNWSNLFTIFDKLNSIVFKFDWYRWKICLINFLNIDFLERLFLVENMRIRIFAVEFSIIFFCNDMHRI